IKTMLPKLGAQRVAVMGQLADVVTKMHEAGARQTDQHIGNWVYDGSKVYLLDAGTVRFAAGPLSRAERVNDLATLSATLDLPSQDAFRSAQGNAPYAGELPALTVKQQARRLKKHYKKTRRNCTEYKRQDGPAHRGVSANQADQSLVEAFFNSPESFVKQGTRLKSGNTCTVQSFEYQGKAYVLKRYNLKPLPTRLRYSLKESRAMKSWSNAWCLLTAHIPTARPVAVYEERRGILRGRCYLLMEKVEGVLLADYIEKIADAKVLSETAGAVAQVWRGLANIRAVHKDMKATNWIINKRGRAVIFDLDSMVLAQSKHYFEHGRRKDFQRFMKNVSNSPEVEKEFRKQLLEAGQ
ncbi:MAG: lipopolysaccharide kinase InaA family protein, partial [Opitutales bacterium]